MTKFCTGPHQPALSAEVGAIKTLDSCRIDVEVVVLLQLQSTLLTTKRRKFAAWWATWRWQNVSIEQERHARDWLRQTQSTRLSRFRAREKRL